MDQFKSKPLEEQGPFLRREGQNYTIEQLKEIIYTLQQKEMQINYALGYALMHLENKTNGDLKTTIKEILDKNDQHYKWLEEQQNLWTKEN